MAINKIINGMTGAEAAQIIYENDMQAVSKEEIGYTTIAAGTEWATELINSNLNDPLIWHLDKTYNPTNGQLTTGTTAGFAASVKRYEIPVGDYEFTAIMQIITGTVGLCLYDENGVFIKTINSLRNPVVFNTERAKYFTVTHRTTLPVSGISVKNNTSIFSNSTVIFALKAETPTNQDLQNLAQSTNEAIEQVSTNSVTKSELGISEIAAGTEWATELKNSNPEDLTIWYVGRIYAPTTGVLSSAGNPAYTQYNASVKRYEIPVGDYEFTAIMQVVLGSTGLCLYDENGIFIKTVVSLLTPVVFNTERAKYFTVTYRNSRPVSGISVKNNTPIQVLENPLFIPASREDEFLKKGDIPAGIVFNRFSEVEAGDSFPSSCEVGLFDLVRNTDVKSGNVMYDYNVKGQNFPKLRKAQILNKVEILREICDVSENGDLFAVLGKSILVSTDLGANWNVFVTLPQTNGLYWVFCLGNGELMALDATIKSTTDISQDIIGGVYVSSNGRTEFTKVHTYRNRYQYIVPSWGVEQNGADIYFSEYGNSYPEDTTIDPSWNKGTKADATRIWKSTNYGQNFAQFVDLNTLTSLYPANGNLHIHGIHFDKYWNRLWLTSGDGGGAVKSNKKLAWTDNGLDWHGIDLSKYFSGGGAGGTPYDNLQGLSMFSTNEVLLIGADCWNNAIFRVNKRKRHEVYLEVSYNPSPQINDDITYFTSRFTQYAGTPIFIPFGRGDSATDNGKNNRFPKIAATWNGLTFIEFWIDLNTPTGCLQESFRVWKIRGKYYIHIKYPTTLKQYLIEIEL